MPLSMPQPRISITGLPDDGISLIPSTSPEFREFVWAPAGLADVLPYAVLVKNES